MTAREVARCLNIGYNTLLRKVQDDEIPHSRVGKTLRFRREDVEAYLGAPLPAPRPEPAKPKKPKPRAPQQAAGPVLTRTYWWERYEALGQPDELPLDLFLTLPDDAFDYSEAGVPQWRTCIGDVVAAIIKNAPRSYLVSCRVAGEWHDLGEQASIREACWAVQDVIWRAILQDPKTVDEQFVELLRTATLEAHRLQIEQDVRSWRRRR